MYKQRLLFIKLSQLISPKRWAILILISLLADAHAMAERILHQTDAFDEQGAEVLFSLSDSANFFAFPQVSGSARRRIMLEALVPADRLNDELILQKGTGLYDSSGALIGTSYTAIRIHDFWRYGDSCKIWLSAWVPNRLIDPKTVAENWLEDLLSNMAATYPRDSLKQFAKLFNPIINKETKDYEAWTLPELLPKGIRIQLIFYKNVLQRASFNRSVSIKNRESAILQRGQRIYYFQNLDDKGKDRLNRAFPVNSD